MGISNSRLLKSKGYEKILQIGKGKFGEVFLYTDTVTQTKKYAIKFVKNRVISAGMEVVKLRKLKSEEEAAEFITKHIEDFVNKNTMFIVLEYVPGKFFNLLHHESLGGCFEEETAKFYSMQVILALEYVHSRLIIHGDLKPENILLGTNGYLKLTDFGSARFIRHRSSIPCLGFKGTVEYVAPEIIRTRDYSEAVDWWALGVLIYEMLSGKMPFNGDDDDSTKNNIKNVRFSYPPGFKQSTISLIGRFLIHDPMERVKNLRNLSSGIKSDPWFEVENRFNWSSILKRQDDLPVQIKSIIEDDFDTLG